MDFMPVIGTVSLPVKNTEIEIKHILNDSIHYIHKTIISNMNSQNNFVIPVLQMRVPKNLPDTRECDCYIFLMVN